MFKYALYGFLGLIGTIALIYALWAAFIPMMIGGKIVEREIIQQSPQYVISQRSAMSKLYVEYLKSDGGVKTAIKHQMCEIGGTIPKSEWNNNNLINICQNY